MQISHTIGSVLFYFIARSKCQCQITISRCEICQYVPPRRFLCGCRGACVRPFCKIHIRHDVVLVVIPNIVGIGALAVGHFRFPVFGCLLQDIDLCALVECVAENRLICYLYDIREVLALKSIDSGAIYLNISQYSRVSGRNDRVDGINLIRYGVVVRLDCNDRRVMYSTRLDEYRLCLVGFLILHRERTRAERHLYIKVAFCFIL